LQPIVRVIGKVLRVVGISSPEVNAVKIAVGSSIWRKPSQKEPKFDQQSRKP